MGSCTFKRNAFLIQARTIFISFCCCFLAHCANGTMFIYCNTMSKQLLGAAEVRDTWHVLPFFGGVICLSWRQYSPKGIKEEGKNNVNCKVRCQTPLFHLTQSPKTGAVLLGYSLWFCEKWLANTQKTGHCFSCVHLKQELHLSPLLPPSKSTKQFNSATVCF